MNHNFYTYPRFNLTKRNYLPITNFLLKGRHMDQKFSTPISTNSILFAVFSAVLMGTIGVFSKITGLGPEIITFYRLLFGAVFMVIYLSISGKLSLLKTWPSWPVLINGGFLSGFIIFYIAAMNYTTMANAIMLVYLAPVAASIFAHFFLKEKLTIISIGLIIMALFGFAMMMEFHIDLQSGSKSAIGIIYGLLALVAYAGFILVNRIIPVHIHVYNRTFYQLLIGALCMLPFIINTHQHITQTDWLWLTGAGLFPGFLAILFVVIALSKLPATIFGTLAYFEPIAVVIFGWTIFGESLNMLQLSGCGIIMISGILQAIMSTRNN